MMMLTAVTSFVGEMRTAIGGPMSQLRICVSCLQTAPNQDHQTKPNVLIASVVKNCKQILTPFIN